MRGGVLATAQTANLLLLGIHLSDRNQVRAWSCLIPILCFVAGTYLAKLAYEILLIIIVGGVFYFLSNSNQFTVNILVPDFLSAVKNLGFTGLVTNILINLSWQFVDNSSWQIISSGCEEGVNNTNRSL